MIEIFNIDDLFFITSANKAIEFNGQEYTEKFIVRESVENRELVSDCNISLELRDEVVNYLRFSSKSKLKVFRKIESEFHHLFSGNLAGVVLEGSLAKCKFVSVLSRLASNPKTRLLIKTCPFNLFDGNCKLNSTAFQVSTIVLSAGSNSLQLSVIDETYKLGYCSHNSTDYFISNVIGDVAYFFVKPNVTINEELLIFPGCDKQAVTCLEKFTNSANFGGFIETPDIEPAGISLVGGSL